LKRLAKATIIPEAPAFRGETIRAWLPRQRFGRRHIASFHALIQSIEGNQQLLSAGSRYGRR
jgi:hypothetical protein